MGSHDKVLQGVWLSRLGRCADTLEDAAGELQAVMTVVEATSQPMSRRDLMRPYMDIIYKYAQDKSPFKPSMVPTVIISDSLRLKGHLGMRVPAPKLMHMLHRFTQSIVTSDNLHVH